MKVGILASSALVVAVILGAFALPDSYVVERSRLVKASPEAVYGMLIDVDESAYWAPWRAVDRHMQVAAGEVKKGVGASYVWKSRDHGGGSYTIVKATEPVRIEAELDLGDAGEVYGTWKLDPVADGVSVQWRFVGETTGLMGRYFALGLDAVVGPLFDDALDRLQLEAERRARVDQAL